MKRYVWIESGLDLFVVGCLARSLDKSLSVTATATKSRKAMRIVSLCEQTKREHCNPERWEGMQAASKMFLFVGGWMGGWVDFFQYSMAGEGRTIPSLVTNNEKPGSN